MAKKKNQMLDRVIGAATGAGLAVATDYVANNLLGSMSGYTDYVKIGLGIVLPMVIDEPMVQSGSDVLLGIGIANVVEKMLPTSTTTSTDTVAGVPGAYAIGQVPGQFAIGRTRGYSHGTRRPSGRMRGTEDVKTNNAIC